MHLTNITRRTSDVKSTSYLTPQADAFDLLPSEMLAASKNQGGSAGPGGGGGIVIPTEANQKKFGEGESDWDEL